MERENSERNDKIVAENDEALTTNPIRNGSLSTVSIFSTSSSNFSDPSSLAGTNSIQFNDTNGKIVENYTREVLKVDPSISLNDLPTDAYGFIMENQSSDSSYVPEEGKTENASSNIKKWIDLVQNWDCERDRVKLKRVFAGVPDSLRAESWRVIMGISKRKHVYEGTYAKLLKIAYATSESLEQIDKDVARTFQNNIHFKKRYGPMQRSLFNILAAYSIHNKELGYTQGMSEIAALLISVFENEEDSFFALCFLMSEPGYCMHGLFMQSFEKYLRFTRHHHEIIEKMLPDLKAHFDQNYLILDVYTQNWFLRGFVLSLPFSLTLRIWDVFVYTGDKIIHPTAYTIWKFHKKKLLKMTSLEEINSFIVKELPVSGIDTLKFMRQLEDNVNELKDKCLYPIPSSSKTEHSLEYSLSDTVSHRVQKLFHENLKRQLMLIEESRNVHDVESTEFQQKEFWGVDDAGNDIPSPPSYSPPIYKEISTTPTMKVKGLMK